MASGFEGYWVHGHTGAGHPVADHARDVVSDPGRYGLKGHEVDAITKGEAINTYDSSPESARGKIVKAAADKGWVRVRANRGNYVMQMSGGAASKVGKVLGYLRKQGVHPNSSVHVHDFASGYHQKFDGFSGVRAAVSRGEVPDFVSKEAHGAEAKATLGKAKAGIPASLSGEQHRAILRQRIGAGAGIPDRDVEEAVAYVQKVAAKQGRSVDAVEKDWSRAKQLATAQYGGKTKHRNPDKFYAVTTHIFKNIVGAHGAVESVGLPPGVSEDHLAEVNRFMAELWESSYPDYEWTAWLRSQEEGMWDDALRRMWSKRLTNVSEAQTLLEMPWLPTPHGGTYDPELETHGKDRAGFMHKVTRIFSGDELHDKYHDPASDNPESGRLHLKTREHKLAFLQTLKDDPMFTVASERRFGVPAHELEKHIRGVIDRTSPPGSAA